MLGIFKSQCPLLFPILIPDGTRERPSSLLIVLHLRYVITDNFQGMLDEWGMGMNGDEWGLNFTHSSQFIPIHPHSYKHLDSLDIVKNLKLIHSNRLNHELYSEPSFSAHQLYLLSHTLNWSVSTKLRWC